MAKAAKPGGKKGGKKERKNVPHAVAHIHATCNNTVGTITDPTGSVLSWSAAGVEGVRHRSLPPRSAAEMSIS